MIQSFKPVINDKSTILILGTAPGAKSLECNQYYANSRNQFWKILYALFEEEYQEDYEKRLTFLSKHHIALWDVIKHCNRKSSLDVDIKDEEIHDFKWLFNSYPNIRIVIFNGAKAYKVFKKKVGFNFKGVEFHQLCSTSPAHAVTIEKKLKEWSIIKATGKE